MSATDVPSPERTNPLLWLIGLLAIMAILVGWFSHWFDTGRAHGRGIVIPVEHEAAPVDHAKLIADRSPAVLDRGEQVFQKTCVICHGPTGQEKINAQARDFHHEPFKNPNKGGPYGLYTVLENGFNGVMPPQVGLSPEDKYAVIHFIRETWVKKDNAANYLENDPPEIAKLIPKKGEGHSGPEIPPARRPVEVPVKPLLAAIAGQDEADAAAADAWLKGAAAGVDNAVAARALAALTDHRGSGGVTSLYVAAKAKDAKAVRELLARPDGGVYVPGLAAMASADASALTQHLITSASSAPERAASAGAK